MRVVVSAGGTGGHVYPALAVVEPLLREKPSPALSEQWPEAQQGVDRETTMVKSLGAKSAQAGSGRATELLWIGSQGGLEEELVRRAGIPFVGLPAGGLRGKGVGEAIRNSMLIAKGVHRARDLLAQFRPKVILVTGGYACVAVTVAAWLSRIPVLIYLPDIEPGLAVRFLSHLASRVAVTSEESLRHFPEGKAVVTGYPVRHELFQMQRTEARQRLGLDPQLETVLVFGGSRGARSINQALVAGLHNLLKACQVIHVSGRLDADTVADATKNLPAPLGARYHHFAYLHDMPIALAAADLVVARAGAATLGEFPAVGLPAIVVPYPYSGQHQGANAEYLARKGAARVLPDSKLVQELVPTVLHLLDNKDELNAMRQSAKAIARPDAAQAIARQLWQLAHNDSVGQAGAKP